MCSDYSEEREKVLQEQLTRVILRLLVENPALHYYQGLHDVVMTILLVVDEDPCYAIMKVLTDHHIRCCYMLAQLVSTMCG